MGEHSKIEWCDHTFNPWWGCTKISPGCDHCYAEHQSRRFGAWWGAGAERRTFSEEHWRAPLKWNERARKSGTRPRVFCSSMADVFDTDAPAGERERLWALIRATPHLTWLLLTKRIGNAARMLPADWGDGYANVGLGATIVNQPEADRDIDKLRSTRARWRFLSIEPMLSAINIAPYLGPRCDGGSIAVAGGGGRTCETCGGYGDDGKCGAIGWVICGGESGHGARPMHPDWARSLRDQCAAAGVPFFFKQWGVWAPYDLDSGAGRRDWMILDVDGGLDIPDHRAPAEEAGEVAVVKQPKLAAGRLLDGVEHNAFPVHSDARRETAA